MKGLTKRLGPETHCSVLR